MSHNILVTGGAGYLGSVLVPELLAAGHEVTVLDNFMFGQNSLANVCHDPRFQVIRGDARSEDVLNPLLRQADVVIPLAALVGAPLCARDPIGATSTNRDAILTLLRNLGRDQWVLMSTTNTGYGGGEPGKMCTEDSPLRPVSLYGVDKVEVERAVLEHENAISFRLASVFGISPRMRIDLLVNDFTYRAVHDRFVVVFEGHFKRNYIHIRDVARVFLHAIDNFATMRGRPYNVGLSKANLSKIELCQLIRRHLPEFVYFEAPVGEDPDKRDYIVSNARLEGTGFRLKYSLDDGIEELVKGYTMLRNTRYGNV